MTTQSIHPVMAQVKDVLEKDGYTVYLHEQMPKQASLKSVMLLWPEIAEDLEGGNTGDALFLVATVTIMLPFSTTQGQWRDVMSESLRLYKLLTGHFAQSGGEYQLRASGSTLGPEEIKQGSKVLAQTYNITLNVTWLEPLGVE